MSGTFSQITEIPANIAAPGVYTQIVSENSGNTLRDMPLRVLLIGVVASGAGKPLTLYEDVNSAQVSALAGLGSATDQMARALFTEASSTPTDLIMVAPAAGATPTTWVVTPTGAPATSGQVVLYVNGVRVVANVTTAMSAAQIGVALFGAWSAGTTQKTGFTAVFDETTGAITLTSVDKGAWTTNIAVRAGTSLGDTTPGVTLGLTPTYGSGVPDITEALTLVANRWYTDISWIFADSGNLAALSIEGARRYTAMVSLDAHIYLGLSASYGQALGVVSGLNSPHISILPADTANWAPWEAAGSLCGIAANALNADPARQLRTLQLTALAGRGPSADFYYTRDMRNQMLNNGLSTFIIGNDGSVILERVVTTKRFDVNGTPTTSWMDIMVPKTASRIRYAWNTYVKSTYPRAKLADNNSTIALNPNAGVVTPKTLHTSWAGQSALYEQQGWIENTTELINKAQFQRAPNDRNTVQAYLPIQIIGSLIVLENILALQE